MQVVVLITQICGMCIYASRRRTSLCAHEHPRSLYSFCSLAIFPNTHNVVGTEQFCQHLSHMYYNYIRGGTNYTNLWNVHICQKRLSQSLLFLTKSCNKFQVLWKNDINMDSRSCWSLGELRFLTSCNCIIIMYCTLRVQ